MKTKFEYFFMQEIFMNALQTNVTEWKNERKFLDTLDHNFFDFILFKNYSFIFEITRTTLITATKFECLLFIHITL